MKNLNQLSPSERAEFLRISKYCHSVDYGFVSDFTRDYCDYVNKLRDMGEFDENGKLNVPLEDMESDERVLKKLSELFGSNGRMLSREFIDFLLATSPLGQAFYSEMVKRMGLINGLGNSKN